MKQLFLLCEMSPIGGVHQFLGAFPSLLTLGKSFDITHENVPTYTGFPSYDTNIMVGQAFFSKDILGHQHIYQIFKVDMYEQPDHL